jgi:hypothetical protein
MKKWQIYIRRPLNLHEFNSVRRKQLGRYYLSPVLLLLTLQLARSDGVNRRLFIKFWRFLQTGDGT